MSEPEFDPMTVLAQVLRKRLERGEIVVPNLLKFMDDNYPGWLETPDNELFPAPRAHA